MIYWATVITMTRRLARYETGRRKANGPHPSPNIRSRETQRNS
jgi:hypothetical protein